MMIDKAIGMAGAILVAAGESRRMAGTDKAFAALCGRPVLAYSLAALDAVDEVGRIVLVVAERRLTEARAIATGPGRRAEVVCVSGGERRRDSVLAGLRELDGYEWAIVHDAARPLVTADLVRAGLAAARQTGAAVPGVPLADTVKTVGPDGRVIATPDRSELRAVQTPQVFDRLLLLGAHQTTDDDVTDDAALVERLGAEVVVFPGDSRNIKITLPDDLVIAAALLRGASG